MRTYKEVMLLLELERIVGEENVILDPTELVAASIDVWWVTRYFYENNLPAPAPFAIVAPGSTEEVVRLVEFANEHRIPLIPRGGGAGDGGGTSPTNGGVIVDLKRMDKVLEINRKSQTVRAQTGILQIHLEEALNREGMTMNYFPASINTSTLGGFISTNGSGVFSSKYGKMADLVHALQVVLPSGTVFESPPVRLHSSGPDYTRVFIGAEGTFGVVTEAVCKIFAQPEVRKFKSFRLPDLGTALEAGRQVMNSGVTPALMRLYDPEDGVHILKNQYGVDAASGVVFLTAFDGPERLVDVELAIASDIFLANGADDLGGEQGEKWWNNRLKSYYPPLDYVCKPWMTAVTCTVSPYEDIEALYYAMKKAVEEGFAEFGAKFHGHFSHWYTWGCSLYPTFLIKDVPDDPMRAMRLYYRITDACIETSLAHNGVINEHHGIGLRLGRYLKKAYGPGYEVARRIKRGLDEHNLLNPGKLGLGDY